MPSSTTEDYLKTILIQEEADPGSLVSTGRIAEALALTPGTVTTMVKGLERNGQVVYEKHRGVRLTEAGRNLARHVIRRHRLIERFLVDVLGLDWSEVHEEAEKLEHAFSDKVIDRLDALLGHPATDPHGDPIPDVEGEYPASLAELTCLTECPPGDGYRLSRVSDQDEAFLRFAERHGLKPGALLVVHSQDPAARAVTVHAAEHDHVTLGREAAAKLWVERRER
ncbi:MAG: metal-dependent transcriptional regulator [Acidobacteriota bacterium]